MHLLIPFAAPLAEAGRAALASLELPRLRAFLSRAETAARDGGDEWSYSPPHERALALALGYAGGDGELPWAAHQARTDGIDTGDLAWGLLTPVHWLLGTEQVSLMDPAALALDEASSRTLFDAARPLFESEGFALAWGAPLRWYAAHESFAALRTASPDRVIGRNVDRWLVGGPSARLVRRLQNEVQMLFHTHPLNADREARGLLPVNSFWLSGCGRAQQATGAAPQVDERLRGPALAEDWAAWCKAWDMVDEAVAAATRLTLCGERSSVTLVPGGGWSRLTSMLRAPRPAALLETL